MKSHRPALIGISLLLVAPTTGVACGFGTPCGVGMGRLPLAAPTYIPPIPYYAPPAPNFVPQAPPPPPQSSGPSAAELEQRRVAHMNEANEMGIAAFARKDWATAIKYFREALEFSPYNPALAKNLQRAEQELEIAQDSSVVDLRGKRGIPEDLKKYNPPARSLHIKEPPSPHVYGQVDPPRGTPAPGYVNPTNGGLPPGGGAAAAVLVQPRPIR